MTSGRLTALLAAACALLAAGLWARDAAAAATTSLRLLPVLGFVVLISVVVNLARSAGAFDAILAALSPLRGRAGAWLTVLGFAVVSTVFLSLDTTVILATPVAVALARREHLHPLVFALPVVWTANLASLVLPVSNLTNLLAVESGVFASRTEFSHLLRWPSWVGVAAAVVAAGVCLAWGMRDDAARRRRSGSARTSPQDVGSAAPGPIPDANDHAAPRRRHPLRPLSLTVLAVLLPLLATPVPYWLSAGVAALLLLTAFSWRDRAAVRWNLVPWPSVFFAAALSFLMVLLQPLLPAWQLSGYGTGGLLATAGVGAVAANVVNNIPAYVALEPLAFQPGALAALLIGANLGPLVTPWASLATLLWADQLRRSGVRVRWSFFALAGCAVSAAAVMGAVSCLAAMV